MKKRRILCVIRNNKGMALFQFMLMLFLVFVLIAVFVEIGAVLRSEAIIVNSAVKLAKIVQSTGHLGDISNEQSKLTNLGITDFNVQVTPPSLTFRQNFTLVATANYKTRFGGFLAGVSGISFPLKITLKGKSERFQ